MHRIAIALILGALIAGQAGASTITWGPATDTTGPSDIANTGTLFKAFNSGGAAVNVNGVAFDKTNAVGDDINFSFFSGAAGGGSLGNAALLALLDTATYTQLQTPSPVTLTGLTPGSPYELQLFFMDQRSFSVDRTVTYSSGGNSVTLEADPNNASTAPFGQYVIGTFTADATTQGFVITGPIVQQVNAWQLRVVPEPSSLALLGLGVGLLVLQRRLARP